MSFFHGIRSFAGDAAFTHLEYQETPVAPETSPLAEETSPTPLAPVDNFRHSGWKHARLAIFRAMQELQLPYERLSAFAECGTDCWLMRSTTDPEHFKTVPDHCHDRFCVPCGGQRQATIRRNLDHLLKHEPHRFLTLTIRHDRESLPVLLARLYKAFRLLRQRTLWKERVRGGVAFLELTYNSERGDWNPHLHCMLEGLYIDLQDLVQLWLACTGDSRNVKIKLVSDRHVVTNYITKYTTKPLPASIVEDPDALKEAIRALIGKRMIVTFGTWRNWKLLDDPADKGWEFFAHLRAVRSYSIPDDLLCENILAMVDSADPRTGEFYVHVEVPDPDI